MCLLAALCLFLEPVAAAAAAAAAVAFAAAAHTVEVASVVVAVKFD